MKESVAPDRQRPEYKPDVGGRGRWGGSRGGDGSGHTARTLEYVVALPPRGVGSVRYACPQKPRVLPTERLLWRRRSREVYRN